MHNSALFSVLPWTFEVRVVPDTLGESSPYNGLDAGREDIGRVVVPSFLSQALIGAKLDVIETCSQ